MDVRPDPDYLKELLTAFQDASSPTTDILELKQAGFDYENDPRFELHLFLLADQGFVTSARRDGSLGMERSTDGFVQWSVIALRLTASGNEFADALRNNKIRSSTRSRRTLPGASIATIREAAMILLKEWITKHAHF
jgi:hypothetical protein